MVMTVIVPPPIPSKKTPRNETSPALVRPLGMEGLTFRPSIDGNRNRCVKQDLSQIINTAHPP